MAAIETPWMDQMSSSSTSVNNSSSANSTDPNPPTYASFSPSTLGHYPSVTKNRSTILVHQKSPLLLATPPQLTRALAYSHPFILPLNKIVGLLSWTTGDPWESFLLVAAFWAITIYGDVVLRYVGPIVLVSTLILTMYARRYSPLSSTGWTGEKAPKGRARADSSTRHHKSLDEIVESLKLFTARCNIMLDPFLRMTDFLSTQSTATSATTRPALTSLFIRILFITPVWFALTLPPLYIITTKRLVLTIGTISLSWHSRPARVSRTLLWRSRLIRRISSLLTGLDFGEYEADPDKKGAPPLPPRRRDANAIAASLAAKRKAEPGIRFTFTLYENQRRWIALGWTSSMLAYERANWTDEALNSSRPKDRFELPSVEGAHAKWQWVPGSEWRVEGAETIGDTNGWIYYDNKWHKAQKTDGWGKYTRRRKWARDAELVEISDSDREVTPSATPNRSNGPGDSMALSDADTVIPDDQGDGLKSDAASIISTTSTASAKKRRWFKRRSRPPSMAESGGSKSSIDLVERSEQEADRQRRRDEGEDVYSPIQVRDRENEWGLGDDARIGLG